MSAMGPGTTSVANAALQLNRCLGHGDQCSCSKLCSMGTDSVRMFVEDISPLTGNQAADYESALNDGGPKFTSFGDPLCGCKKWNCPDCNK
jgi:hypothetical protein